MDKLATYSPLIGRIFLGLFFLLAGVGKVADPAGTAGYIQSVGLPGLLAWPAILFEIALGLAMLVGFKTRLAALAGAVLLSDNHHGRLRQPSWPVGLNGRRACPSGGQSHRPHSFSG